MRMAFLLCARGFVLRGRLRDRDFVASISRTHDIKAGLSSLSSNGSAFEKLAAGSQARL
jgi:hypothetical protein